jgi:SAM-dependent methyltransferase
MLLPDQLKSLWQCVDQGQLDADSYCAEKERLLAEHGQIWKKALLLEGQEELYESTLAELGLYLGCQDRAEVLRRCLAADADLDKEWRATVDSCDRQSVERFYDDSDAQLYELLRWHTLCDDNSPLAYVTALHFARQQECASYLDFGAGPGSGGVLFARHGFDVVLADIAAPVLRFSQWRLGLRKLPARVLDLKEAKLPARAFDFVTAMDVFEHLFDPVAAIEELWTAMKPGGYIYGRFHADADDHEQSGHIVRDFAPTFQRMAELGLTQVWEDQWLWGHKVFRKSYPHC